MMRLGQHIALVLMSLCGCVALPSADSPREYLDSSTAATVDVVGRPLVFAHERPELAVHMRDYITVAAAAVDRAGEVHYVLIAYFWTTFDAHGQSGEGGGQSKELPSAPTPDPFILLADDRQIGLKLEGHSARDAGIGEPVDAPPGHAQPNVYRTDLATLRFLAAAQHLAVRLTGSDADSAYKLWDDRRPALTALVRRIERER